MEEIMKVFKMHYPEADIVDSPKNNENLIVFIKTRASKELDLKSSTWKYGNLNSDGSVSVWDYDTLTTEEILYTDGIREYPVGDKYLDDFDEEEEEEIKEHWECKGRVEAETSVGYKKAPAIDKEAILEWAKKLINKYSEAAYWDIYMHEEDHEKTWYTLNDECEEMTDEIRRLLGID